MTAPAAVRAHVDGLLTLLAAQATGVGVYRGEAPAGAALPYVVLYTDPGTPEGSLGDRHRDLLIEFQATAVGRTSEQAEWAADKVRGVLLTQQPTVTGRVVQPLWQAASGPRVQRDDDLTPPVFYLPVIYQMRTEPA